MRVFLANARRSASAAQPHSSLSLASFRSLGKGCGPRFLAAHPRGVSSSVSSLGSGGGGDNSSDTQNAGLPDGPRLCRNRSGQHQQQRHRSWSSANNSDERRKEVDPADVTTFALRRRVISGGGALELSDRRRRGQVQRTHTAMVCRHLHTTPHRENQLIIASIGAAAGAYALKVSIDAYQNHRKNKEAEAVAGGGDASSGDSAAGGFASAFGRRFYEGGFERDMDKDEAAKILGVRKSAPLKRIKMAHRKLLMINHPDAGGSKLIAGKINEAKEVLSQGRSNSDD